MVLALVLNAAHRLGGLAWHGALAWVLLLAGAAVLRRRWQRELGSGAPGVLGLAAGLLCLLLVHLTADLDLSPRLLAGAGPRLNHLLGAGLVAAMAGVFAASPLRHRLRQLGRRDGLALILGGLLSAAAVEALNYPQSSALGLAARASMWAVVYLAYSDPAWPLAGQSPTGDRWLGVLAAFALLTVGGVLSSGARLVAFERHRERAEAYAVRGDWAAALPAFRAAGQAARQLGMSRAERNACLGQMRAQLHTGAVGAGVRLGSELVIGWPDPETYWLVGGAFMEARRWALAIPYYETLWRGRRRDGGLVDSLLAANLRAGRYGRLAALTAQAGSVPPLGDLDHRERALLDSAMAELVGPRRSRRQPVATDSSR
jgi:hypothetical protein